ncbi:putative dienelactone hydrolase [Actinacidiphila reveromycinica]|uniref:Putative dienelactone hydrolase n=1 Tax=Actinacidiphila reveromycinica TaxID=659352 RepID=A0A7U3UPJ4_9ACTN|nr:dienelactone hydrolase family protein [Streptomyces sp. SN-593]BBA96348.1 putative dienelactone hydrolase [Streptomyces sp. SN-593]
MTSAPTATSTPSDRSAPSAPAPAVTARDVEYRHGATRLIGHLCVPAGGAAGPAVLLLPDAYGVSGHMTGLARRLAGLGHATLVADLWGDGLLPADQAEFGPLIGAMAADRAHWTGRVRAAHEALLAQEDADTAAVVALGYCFGGSSALEYARTGGEVAGVVSVHGGLDILAFDWSAAHPAPVLVCTGAQDPMATPGMRADLTAAMTAAGLDWQEHVYSRTVHAFTSPTSKSSARPDVVAYSARSTARAWDATLRFLREVGDPRSAA